MFLWRLWRRRHRDRSGAAHHLSHGLGDFLRQRSCVLSSYKTWQMHLGSLWAGSKKLPALEFLQVFMLGNDVFNFLNIFIYGVCLCTHTCAQRTITEVYSLLLPHGFQESNQVVRIGSKFLFLLSHLTSPENKFYVSTVYSHFLWVLLNFVMAWNMWPLAVAFWVLRSQVSVSFQLEVIVRCVCFLPFCL